MNSLEDYRPLQPSVEGIPLNGEPFEVDHLKVAVSTSFERNISPFGAYPLPEGSGLHTEGSISQQFRLLEIE